MYSQTNLLNLISLPAPTSSGELIESKNPDLLNCPTRTAIESSIPARPTKSNPLNHARSSINRIGRCMTKEGPSQSLTDLQDSLRYTSQEQKDARIEKLRANYGDSCSASVSSSILNLCARLHDQDPALREVDLQDIKMNQDELRILLRSLADHTASQTVNLSGGKLKDDGLAEVVAALCDKPTLTAFSIDHNFLSQKSASSIVTLLEAHPELTRLSIRANKLQDSGAALLAECIKRHPGLVHLDMRYCVIYEKGARNLNDAIRDKTGFTLELSDNPTNLTCPLEFS